MKLFIVGFTLLAVACVVAENFPSSEYLPPAKDIGIPSNEYLGPIAPAAPIAEYSSGVLADDGYRYKTVKRFRSRHRRDVNELSNEYLPPFQQHQISIPQESYSPVSSFSAPLNEYLAPIAPAAPIAQYSSGVLADDGYRYKTVKRFKTAKRFRSRHRRDVSELSNEYLPPFQQQISIPQESYAPVSSFGAPSNEYLAPIAPAAPIAQYSSGVLADDGYRYKTVKRFKTAKRFRSRHRRDVSELSNEYLPPFQQQVSIPQESYAPISSFGAPSNEYLAPIAPAAPIAQYSSGVLADDGYRYKTVKRFKTAKRFRSRHRRDVSELSNEYLPPFQQQVSIPQESYAPISSFGAPSNEYLAPIAPAAPIAQYSSGVLADDGYRYKTVKRFKTAKRFRSRHRRDVSELSNEYLPPFQQQVSIPQESYAPISSFGAPSNEYLAPIAPAAPISQYSSGVLADDGYRYKTVKRFKTAKRFRSRHRRDVNELSNEYLPPFQQQISIPQESYAPISSFGAPSNEYLAPIAPAAPIAQYSSGVLADDGYRYKTVKRFRTAKRFRSRHRRDVNELSNEYLPPFQQQISIPEESYAPISSFAAPSNEYLAPIAPAAPITQYSSGVLADDGYRYKTVKRFRTVKRYRSRH